MARRIWQRPLYGLGLLLTAALLGGCDMVLLNPKGMIGLEERSLILTALGLMLIVVIPVIGMALFFAWRYRAANTDATYAPEWAHSSKIEFIVWCIPIMIILALGTITWRSTHALDPYKPLVSDVKPIEVHVISLDWKWLFIYPEYGVASINELAFPINTPINFKITANTVMNSFFIPQLGGQMYSMAGMQTKLHLIANEAGDYAGISSGYSGKGFSGMKFTAKAMATPAEFDAWLAKVKQSPHKIPDLAAFDVVAKPSEFHPVEYFSSANPQLFRDLITRFLGTDGGHGAAHGHAAAPHPITPKD